MKQVSFQGPRLTASDRAQLARRAELSRSLFLNATLTNQVNQTIAVLELRKEQGSKPEKIWFLDRLEKGTPFVGDAFGF